MNASPPDETDVLGRRIGAGLIDLLIAFFVLGTLVAALTGELKADDGEVGWQLDGGPALVLLLVALAYYFVTEAFWGGRTVGKRLLGLRVASADGGAAGPGQIALRTLLRTIDGIGFYLVGLVAVLATGRRRQRLGDLAAKTRVVRA